MTDTRKVLSFSIDPPSDAVRCIRGNDFGVTPADIFHLELWDALQAATKAERAAASQWHDIATAPRDGSPILVYHNRMILETWYSTKWERFVVSETGGTNGIKPTHWMPLPTPPAIRQGGDA